MEIKRKCFVTHKIYERKHLIRFAKKNDQITIDWSLKAPGRGAYCLNDKVVIEELFKKKLLNRVFKANIDQAIYNSLKQQLLEEIENGKEK
ncbi:YlxR family protein [Mycoplasmopsis agassizii]|uniref:DUF448 domain-containing protein n=1 Tax=Mycoplasmopsis agassizii TaxID=33922 RepID=A0ABX4H4D5_9BACT|nr:YlxR family protein [Mycoplasmopsis agassizii]PAF54759.1 DUF448 domain-containing protein [Mycoplasmopsis agassizii]SMC19519.1 hypothetical protein SAMN02745179_00916 [Mycoplasmopsis agassizii]